ncbi:hypothetical protein [Labrys monachus]|uniref:Glycosyltransferase RgtA/B/C/D-like domain-containing protein n=1 Tax=Labrys monachus TaxID=217067 RepID=A0ABU0FJJ8_9HYPH|nr:hypothetical protein [Labrys monachus]MDQ0394777.1 hypothetical protein [Labrys monachus]
MVEFGIESGRISIKKSPYERLIGILGYASLAIYVAAILLSRKEFTYDEPWYLGTIDTLRKYGLSIQFLQNLPGPAGPLYTIVQWSVSPLTNFIPFYVRLVNVILLFVSILFMAVYASRRGYSVDVVSCFACLPTVGVSACLALTEMPAAVFLCGAILGLSVLYFERIPRGVGIIIAAISGLSLGFAILGRQPYLTVLFVLPLLLRGVNIVLITIFAMAALIVTVPVFYIWGGLVPPLTAWAGNGFSLEHGVLSFSYMSIICLIIFPADVVPNVRITSALAGFGGLANEIFHVVSFTPIQGLAHFLPTDLSYIFVRVWSDISVFLAILLIYYVIRRIFSSGVLSFDGFLLAGISLNLASAAKITHQFSSRYVFSALPILFFYLTPRLPVGLFLLIRLAIALLVSLMQVRGYLF